MQIATCQDCGERFTRGEHSERTICRACQGKRASRAQPEDRELARDNGLLEQLSRAGACFAEIGLNRLGHDAKLAAVEILEAGGKLCVVCDLALSEDSVAAARLYLYQRGAKPLLLGQLAAIGETVRPTVLN